MVKYHVLNSGESNVILEYNEYDSLEDALIAGEKVLEDYREAAFDDGWDFGAFHNKIFDTTGRVYYTAVRSGHCDEGIRNFIMCEEDCEGKSIRKCRACKSEDRYSQSGAYCVEDVKWVRCYSFLDISNLYYFFQNSEKHGDLFLKLWAETIKALDRGVES